MNVIWQGDANETLFVRCSIAALHLPLNVTGWKRLVRWVAEFGKIFNKAPTYTGEEAPEDLLNNAAKCFKLFGYPRESLSRMIELIGHWLKEGGETKNKPTHFQEREGKF